MNLIEGIQQECNRLRGVLPLYEKLGPVGLFGLAMIKADIHRGECSIAGGDVIEMLSTLNYLKEQSPE